MRTNLWGLRCGRESDHRGRPPGWAATATNVNGTCVPPLTCRLTKPGVVGGVSRPSPDEHVADTTAQRCNFGGVVVVNDDRSCSMQPVAPFVVEERALPRLSVTEEGRRSTTCGWRPNMVLFMPGQIRPPVPSTQPSGQPQVATGLYTPSGPGWISRCWSRSCTRTTFHSQSTLRSTSRRRVTSPVRGLVTTSIRLPASGIRGLAHPNRWSKEQRWQVP